MKKIIVLIMVIVLALCVTACTDNKPSNETPNQSDTPSTSTSSNKNDNNKNNNTAKLTNTYKVPGKSIYIDVPNYQEMEKGYTELFIVHGEKYVAITANKGGDVASLNAAHEGAIDKFITNIQNYSYVNKLNSKTTSTETINGIEVLKYEGTLECALDYNNRDNSYEAYAIGYSFVLDEVPCTIIGSVINESQDKELINEIKTNVEAMIQTLRSEK